MWLPESCRILIMDDNVRQACLAQSTLARAGYAVELAPGRAEGLTRHAVTSYDVLLIDHEMPGMDGLEILQTLGTCGPFPPTIMVTGQGDKAIAVEAMKRGASDYLVKDVEGCYLSLLPAVVARVLQQHRLAAQKRQAEVALQKILTTLEERVQVRTADLRRVNTQLRAEITRRQRAKATLARLSQQHQLILEASSEGIYGIDRQGKVTFINPAAAQMLGWEAVALHGQVMHDRIHHTRADARSENEPMTLVVLQEPLAHALRLVETRFQREGITVAVDVPPELPLVWGDADQLAQVFLNVLVNAWHAMPGGGTVTMRARQKGPQQVRLTVRDSGVGMNRVTLAHVFEPFYTTKGGQGTGLGLAICQQILDRYGGTIRLVCTPGRGTTVMIELQRADAGV